MFKTTYTYIYRSLVVEPAQAGQRRQMLRLKIGSEDDIYNIQDNIFNIENHIIWMLKTTYAELYTQLLVIVGQRRQMLTMNLVMWRWNLQYWRRHNTGIEDDINRCIHYRRPVVEPTQAGQRRQMLTLNIGSEDDIYSFADNIIRFWRRHAQN